jgi:hypothetical protein
MEQNWGELSGPRHVDLWPDLPSIPTTSLVFGSHPSAQQSVAAESISSSFHDISVDAVDWNLLDEKMMSWTVPASAPISRIATC